MKTSKAKFMVGDILEAVITSENRKEIRIGVGEVVQASYLPTKGWFYYFPMSVSPIFEERLEKAKILKKSPLRNKSTK